MGLIFNSRLFVGGLALAYGIALLRVSYSSSVRATSGYRNPLSVGGRSRPCLCKVTSPPGNEVGVRTPSNVSFGCSFRLLRRGAVGFVLADRLVGPFFVLWRFASGVDVHEVLPRFRS